jgi:hypothetical protein
MNRNADGCAEQRQLLCRRWTTRVSGNKEWPPPLSLQSKCKLCGGRCLPRPLKAEQQNARRPLPKIKFPSRSSKRISQGSMHNANKTAASTKPAHDLLTHGACAHRINKLCCYGKSDVSVKERTANLSEASV